jgi:hypothetical protein
MHDNTHDSIHDNNINANTCDTYNTGTTGTYDTYGTILEAQKFKPFVRRNTKVPESHQQTLNTAYTFEMWIKGHQGVLFTNMKDGNRGIEISITDQWEIEVIIRDLLEENRWRSSKGIIMEGQKHHIGIIIDGGPHIIYFIVDGKLDDGGSEKIAGWGFFSRSISGINGDTEAHIGSNVQEIRIYDKVLMISELILQRKNSIAYICQVV